MIPYFFTGGHWNYVRDSIVNLRMSVYVLLFSTFKKINWLLRKLYMDVFTDVNEVMSINKSIASSHHNVIPSLITVHALSDYNSVTMMFGICKWKTLKAVRKIPLSYVGNVDVNLEDVMWEGKQFVAKCYGRNQLSSSENRCTVWKNKTIDHSVQKVWISSPIDNPLPPPPLPTLYGHLYAHLYAQ